MAMNSRTEISIGERLRFYRKAKGQKQVVVAGLAGITEDYLSQIERDMRTPTIGLLQKLARILRVPVATLLGEPEFEQDGIVHPVASVIQRALTSYGADDDAIGTADLTELRERVTNAWSIWHTSPNRFSEASAILPDLLIDVSGRRALSMRPASQAGAGKRPCSRPTCIFCCGRSPNASGGSTSPCWWRIGLCSRPNEPKTRCASRPPPGISVMF
jgi:transcriptional regulator with XRE-family HTH domain